MVITDGRVTEGGKKVMDALRDLLIFSKTSFERLDLRDELAPASFRMKYGSEPCDLVSVPPGFELSCLVGLYDGVAKEVFGRDHRLSVRGGLDHVGRWTNARGQDGKAYCGIVRQNGLPDDSLIGKSADELDAMGFQGTTVAENLLIHATRLIVGRSRLHEHDQYWRGVLCTGTRNEYGQVARFVYRKTTRQLDLVWDDPDLAIPGVCPQEFFEPSFSESTMTAAA